MCGRFTLTVDSEELATVFNIKSNIPDYRPRYNIAPGQDIPVMKNEQGENCFRLSLSSGLCLPGPCRAFVGSSLYFFNQEYTVAS